MKNYEDITVLVYGSHAHQVEGRIIRLLYRIGCGSVIEAVEGWRLRVPADLIILISHEQVNDKLFDLHLGQNHHYTPLVVIDMSIDPGSRIRYFHSGANDVIPASAGDEEIISRLHNALASRMWINKMMVEKSSLEDELKRWMHRHDETRIEITRRLGRAAEFRDNETGRHVVRVSNFSHTIASTMGLRDENVRLITHASPLHDIGKIGVPDHILMKPGKLDQREWQNMKRHTVIGARIMSGSDDPLMHTAREIALGHHERWDGTGYPKKQKGERIPLAARIVAVADVFDALTSERPYKKPWSYSDAFDYVDEQAGKQFDPIVVEAFLSQKDIVAEIAHLFAEPKNHESKKQAMLWHSRIDDPLSHAPMPTAIRLGLNK